MKSLLLTFMLALSLASSPLTTALANDTDLKKVIRGLTETHILMVKSTMVYEMLKLDGGNPTYSTTLSQIVERIEDLGGSYRNLSLDADITDKLRQLNRSVDTFLEELHVNQQEIAQGGYEQYALVDDMYEQRDKAKELATSIIDMIKATNSVTIDPLVQEGRDLANTLQTLSANYIEQASSISGSALRGGENNNIPIDQLANDITKRLAQYNPQSEKVIGLNAKVRDVKNKWAFLKNSMINFKTDTVPYLTYHYSDKMVDDLLSIADMYENKDQQAIEAPSFSMEPSGDTIPLPAGIPAAQN